MDERSRQLLARDMPAGLLSHFHAERFRRGLRVDEMLAMILRERYGDGNRQRSKKGVHAC